MRQSKKYDQPDHADFTVSDGDIERIVQGQENDPFKILGWHQSEDGVEIRAFIPTATAIFLLDSADNTYRHPMTQLDSDGFFCISPPDRHDKFHYVFDIYWQDHHLIAEDPYRFELLLSEQDNWLLAEGTHQRPYEQLGAHFMTYQDVHGIRFCVWAPNAQRVAVVGDFNFWDTRKNPMRLRPESGIWELFLPDAQAEQCYKFAITDLHGELIFKSDPYAYYTEVRPNTASKLYPLAKRKTSTPTRQQMNQRDQPISIYEVHLGSWKRHSDNRWLTYRELADQLVPYVKNMGFTHIELLPISEHPFDGSWGYQPTNLYAPTSRFGSPEDFQYFVDSVHKAELNLLLDWVPGHFPNDPHGLARFDGTALYEYADPKEGFHQDWNTYIYNYGRLEVKNFLSGNALYWLENYGIDGLRVDAVASMIYRDYSRKPGEWIPNIYGGRENLEAIAFLRQTNQLIGHQHNTAITIAEESTAFYGVTLPPEWGGLGFNYKWNMGWMNDTLEYLKLDPIHRKYHHSLMTFSMHYAYSENYVLAISHDEVVHGKGSLLDRIPGDYWQKFATLRAYYAYMWAHPGKKLLFMGCEFAQGREWNHDIGLDWFLLEKPEYAWHQSIQHLVKDLNYCYRQYPELYQLDYEREGFEWLIIDDVENSVFVFSRRDNQNNEIIIACNFTPVVRSHYRFGINQAGTYHEILNTDSHFYHGSNQGNLGEIQSEDESCHQHPHSLVVTLPPLSTIYLRRAP